MTTEPQNENYYDAIGVWSKKPFGTIRMYIIGYVLAVVLTLIAYVLVTHHVFPSNVLEGCIIVLALLQVFVQFVFFFHFGGGEKASKLRLLMLIISIVYTIIIVAGSIWIMRNLKGRMMPSASQMEQYMQAEQI